MRLCKKSTTLAFGLFWGGAMLIFGISNQIWPGYAEMFLDVVASIYPGYTPGGFGSVIVGTLYGLVDGAIGGWIFAWLYNLFAAKNATA